MREILFRGERVDGSWVEGHYATDENRHYIITDIVDKDHAVYACRSDHVQLYFIKPGSVGQFTGLTDKNGKKIFEGDLLLSKGNLLWLVAFENGGFVCKDEELKTYFTFYEHSYYDSKTKERKSYIPEYEVIGNIHDNPKMFKEWNKNG